MLNHATGTPIKKLNQWIKGNIENSKVDQPSMTKKYNLILGAVHLSDRHLAIYRPRMRSKKCTSAYFQTAEIYV